MYEWGEKVFFQDDTKDGVAGAAIAQNSSLVADAVRCMPLPVSRMPAHAVPLGKESFSACSEEKDETQEPDFTVLLTRPCLSFDEVKGNPFCSSGDFFATLEVGRVHRAYKAVLGFLLLWML